MNIELQYLKRKCECETAHKLCVKTIIIEGGALSKANGFLLEENIGKNPVLICDENTYDAAGKQLYNLIETHEKDIIILPAENLHADEHGVKEVMNQLKPGATVLIAVGAGTIHDITRYVAKQYNVPFISVPTAASVDGFVSTVAAMTIQGFKITYPAVSPIAVFADTNIFSKAPYRLTAAGFADLLGKYTALLDWEISSILTGEYICSRVVSMEKDAVEKVVQSVNGIRLGSKDAYESLMYGLLISGLAMQMIGSSRPASGSEHHMSHLWEMHVINQEIDALHGEKVGVALGIVCDTYKELMKIDDITAYVSSYKGLPYKELEMTFGKLYPSIVEENTPDLLEEVNPKVLVQKFSQVKELVGKLPSGDEVRKILKQAGAKISLEDIGLEDTIIEKSIYFSPFVRRRLTLMRVLKLIEK